MKLSIKWCSLNSVQRAQIKSFYEEQLKEKTLLEHDLNKQSFLINPTNGNFVPRKDF